MFSHRQVWSAIEALAQSNDMSVSRLARVAGLDPTTFNKSKRTAPDGRPRWPSTESLAKITKATDTSMAEFTRLMTEDKAGFMAEFTGLQALSESNAAQGLGQASIPLLGFAEAGQGGYFDDAGFPAGHGWDEVHFPRQETEGAYALEVSGDSMLPLYRDGDTVIVSPVDPVRKGDRVVVRTLEGEVMAKVLARKSATKVDLQSINPDHPDLSFPLTEIDWIARILWASQ